MRWSRAVRWTSSASQPVQIRYLSHPRQTVREYQKKPLDPEDGADAPMVTTPNGTRRNFYEWYLSWRSKPLPLFVTTWTRGLETNPAQLQSTLLDEPLKVFESPEVDLELVASCLEAVIARAIKTTPSKEVERLIYKLQKPGSKALHWYASSAIETHNVALSQRFLRALTYCMVAEHSEEHLWYWLGIDHIPNYARDWSERERRQWKSSVLRFLVEAVIHWTEDQRRALTEGMLAYIRAAEQQRRGAFRGNLHPASNWLTSTLRINRDTKTIDVSTFEQYIAASVPPESKRTVGDEFNHTNLWLLHPVKPQTGHATKLLRSWEEQGEKHPFIQLMLAEKKGISAKSALCSFIIRTAQGLRDQNELAAAHEMLDIGRQLLPSRFQGSMPSSPIHDRRQIEHYRDVCAANKYETASQSMRNPVQYLRRAATERLKQVRDTVSQVRVEDQRRRVELVREHLANTRGRRLR